MAVAGKICLNLHLRNGDRQWQHSRFLDSLRA